MEYHHRDRGVPCRCFQLPSSTPSVRSSPKPPSPPRAIAATPAANGGNAVPDQLPSPPSPIAALSAQATLDGIDLPSLLSRFRQGDRQAEDALTAYGRAHPELL